VNTGPRRSAASALRIEPPVTSGREVGVPGSAPCEPSAGDGGREHLADAGRVLDERPSAGWRPRQGGAPRRADHGAADGSSAMPGRSPVGVLWSSRSPVRFHVPVLTRAFRPDGTRAGTVSSRAAPRGVARIPEGSLRGTPPGSSRADGPAWLDAPSSSARASASLPAFQALILRPRRRSSAGGSRRSPSPAMSCSTCTVGAAGSGGPPWIGSAGRSPSSRRRSPDRWRRWSCAPPTCVTSTRPSRRWPPRPGATRA
jgi:hypothetical protein